MPKDNIKYFENFEDILECKKKKAIIVGECTNSHKMRGRKFVQLEK